jgi:DNA-binding MarR family transcriptional regulator
MTIAAAMQARSPLSQSTLAGGLGISSAYMVQTIDRLARNGLVKRESSASDRRLKRVVVTEAGAHLYSLLRDEVAARETYRDQRNSQEALAAADAEAYHLAEMRFRSGVDNYLTTLDAQRSLYAAQEQLVAVRQAELANQVTLYKALGGGWAQHTAVALQPRPATGGNAFE